MKSFLDEVRGITPVPDKMRAAIDALAAALDAEAELTRRPVWSPLTGDIRNADALRDSSFSKLKALVRAWLGTGIEPKCSAAAELDRFIRRYRLDTAEQLTGETGLMYRMLEELDSGRLRACVETIGATVLVEKMREGNELVSELVRRRAEEGADGIRRGVRLARLATDRAYAEVTDALEAYNYVEGGYSDVIAFCNATVAHYKAVIRRKKAGKKAGGDEP